MARPLMTWIGEKQKWLDERPASSDNLEKLKELEQELAAFKSSELAEQTQEKEKAEHRFKAFEVCVDGLLACSSDKKVTN